MGKVRVHWGYRIDVDIDTDKVVDVYIDSFVNEPVPDGAIRIIILQEPRKSKTYWDVISCPDNYTHVLTYHDEILRTIPKARLFMGTNTWVRGYVSPQKKFTVSTLVGGKVNNAMPGYALRHDLWRAQDKITAPKDFYLSGELRWSEADYTKNKWIEGSIVPLSKAPLFDSQFHIAIENMSIKNMFTEKIIDCFQTKTVPIYYGCTNIEHFFNIKGILCVRDLDEMIWTCNKLTPTDYNEMLPAIDDNYERSHKYCVYDQQVKNAIIELI